MSNEAGAELVQVLTTDLVAITRGRAVAADTGFAQGDAGVGWVPANLALDPFDAIATPNPWGPMGDVRLRPDRATEVRVLGIAGRPPLHFVLADILGLDGAPWPCCPRGFLRQAVQDMAAAGLRLVAAFEQEFTLIGPTLRPGGAFSLAAHRGAEPFLTSLFAAIRDAGVAPEMILPEYGAGQFEVTCAAAEAMVAADRAVIIREVTRDLAQAAGHRASFSPKPRAEGVGNGVHIHLSLRDLAGAAVTYDPAQPGGLSALAGSFVAGILRHMPALCALTAPSPVSYLRLVPGHWSAAFACLGQQNREAALRICPLVAGGSQAARSYNVEFRPADATANPYLALGALIRAGLAGIAEKLPAPPLVAGDPADLTAEARAALGVTRLPESLGAALAALQADSVVRGWFAPDLIATLLAVKRQEIAGAAGLSTEALCARYAAVY